MQKISSLIDIEDEYDSYIFDLWGVIYDGSNLYEGVRNTLERLQDNGKKIAFLSNAEQSASNSREKLLNYGIREDICQNVITSGELTFEYLRDKFFHIQSTIGVKYFYIGDWEGIDFTKLGYIQVDNITKADFIITGSPVNVEAKLEDYTDILNEGLNKKLPLYCANPDLFGVKGNKTKIAFGQLMAYYKENGGQTFTLGKPNTHPFLYALDILQEKDKSKALMIGDFLGTDILGANLTGIDTLLTLGGYHTLSGELKENTLDMLQQKYGGNPTYICNKISSVTT